jgi:hypothetical protein
VSVILRLPPACHLPDPHSLSPRRYIRPQHPLLSSINIHREVRFQFRLPYIAPKIAPWQLQHLHRFLRGCHRPDGPCMTAGVKVGGELRTLCPCDSHGRGSRRHTSDPQTKQQATGHPDPIPLQLSLSIGHAPTIRPPFLLVNPPPSLRPPAGTGIGTAQPVAEPGGSGFIDSSSTVPGTAPAASDLNGTGWLNEPPARRLARAHEPRPPCPPRRPRPTRTWRAGMTRELANGFVIPHWLIGRHHDSLGL